MAEGEQGLALQGVDAGEAEGGAVAAAGWGVGQAGVGAGPVQSGGEGVDEELLCPISMCLMTDPVTAADMHTYQRAALDEYIAYRLGRECAPWLPCGTCFCAT